MHVFVSNSLHCMAPSQVASRILALLSDANVGTLLLNSEYFKGDTSSAKDVDKSDKGTTMKKEHPKTMTVNLRVTSTKFNRNPFSVMIQFLTLSGLIMCQAGKVSDMSSLWHLLNQQRAVHMCVVYIQLFRIRSGTMNTLFAMNKQCRYIIHSVTTTHTHP